MKFGIHETDYKKDQIMIGHSSTELPIPRVMKLGKTEHGFFVISERARGDFLDELDSQRMRDVLPNLFRALDGIRNNIEISQLLRAMASGDRTETAPKRHGKKHCFTTSRTIDLGLGCTDGGLLWRTHQKVQKTLTPHWRSLSNWHHACLQAGMSSTVICFTETFWSRETR